ncbi:MAG: UDP-2,3-diacylglucosamine diphosphatase LpxI [Candidatus Omnitrophota bacterium]
MKQRRLGLIAGCGDFPLLFAEAAKAQGVSLVCVAIKDEASAKLTNAVETIHWVTFGEVKKVIDIFKHEGITRAVMLGGITKTRFFKDRPAVDAGGNAVLRLAKDKKDLTLFKAAALYLRLHGITLVSALICLNDLLARKGTITQREPTARERGDITFGYRIAKRVAGLDIGQTVAVKDKVILAVEAIEGTDSAIRRAGTLGNGGIVIVKTARPGQDMRFDIPVIGARTITVLKEAGVSCLALEKNKTLIAGRAEVARLADEADIAVVVV